MIEWTIRYKNKGIHFSGILESSSIPPICGIVKLDSKQDSNAAEAPIFWESESEDIWMMPIFKKVMFVNPAMPLLLK